MIELTREQLGDFFSCAGISVADLALGIGRELSYVSTPLRTVIVHVAALDTVAYLSDAISRIFDLEENWLLMPRYGDASALGLVETAGRAAGILFKVSDRPLLIGYLTTRPVELGLVSADLYVVSKSGNVLVTWDHHTAKDGLCVQFQQVQDATKALTSLNELGAELDVFYTNR